MFLPCCEVRCERGRAAKTALALSGVTGLFSALVGVLAWRSLKRLEEIQREEEIQWQLLQEIERQRFEAIQWRKWIHRQRLEEENRWQWLEISRLGEIKRLRLRFDETRSQEWIQLQRHEEETQRRLLQRLEERQRREELERLEEIQRHRLEETRRPQGFQWLEVTQWQRLEDIQRPEDLRREEVQRLEEIQRQVWRGFAVIQQQRLEEFQRREEIRWREEIRRQEGQLLEEIQRQVRLGFEGIQQQRLEEIRQREGIQRLEEIQRREGFQQLEVIQRQRLQQMIQLREEIRREEVQWLEAIHWRVRRGFEEIHQLEHALETSLGEERSRAMTRNRLEQSYTYAAGIITVGKQLHGKTRRCVDGAFEADVCFFVIRLGCEWNMMCASRHIVSKPVLFAIRRQIQRLNKLLLTAEVNPFLIPLSLMLLVVLVTLQTLRPPEHPPLAAARPAEPPELWDETIIKVKPKQKDMASCGLYGCGDLSLQVSCRCNKECEMDGTCCEDYHAICKDHSAAQPSTPKEGSCNKYGCLNVIKPEHTCQCTASCRDFGDCCEDFEHFCGAKSFIALEVAPKEDKKEKHEAFRPLTALVHKETQSEKARHQEFLQIHAERERILKWQDVRSCPPQFLDQTLLHGEEVAKASNMSTGAACQKACTEKSDCDAFVWSASTGSCLMVALPAGEVNAAMTPKEGLIAGLPCCRPSTEKQNEVYKDCPEHLADTTLQTSSVLLQLGGIKSAYDCQEACTKRFDCGAFSYGLPPGVPDNMCFLRRLAPDETPRIKPEDGMTSGLPCGCRATPDNAIWPERDVDKFTMPLPRGSKPVRAKSIFCLAVMVPYSYEVGLIAMQYKHHTGIFACDEYQVYSNQALVIAPGLETRKVMTSQECEVGGEFKSALNLRIFAAFWRQVISDGHYLLYNWIVKADPDTVFFVDRLRVVLDKHEEGSRDLASTGVYLNNCKFGLHGPLEVFSQSAVRALTTSFPGCYNYFQKLCSGDCQWGEDRPGR
ncbi:unnamed protein product [Symbiodinium natans]|uniref:SMB domain-containing protein n=1 Tax=Symbiodinium natans TaxID=878477 RepID=A0A812HIN8_9DINO|nr:unnamed protein product [Symbiodinium natans]